jgi:hypothetical protein
MKIIIIIPVLIILLFVLGCHASFHVHPTISPKFEVNKTSKDTIVKKDSHDKNIK